MEFEVTILGNSSANPSYGRHLSAQFIHHGNDYFLVDCGEGTQMQLNAFELKKSRINQIFISHLHGDHFFGLIGLINTFSLLKRTQILQIFCHEALQIILETQLKHTGAILSFPIEYHFLPNEHQTIFETKHLTVEAFPLSHRIACCGFIFKEKIGERKIIKSQVDKYNVPIAQLKDLQQGKDFAKPNGEIIANELLTSAPLPPKSYAYVSDTCYLASIIPIIQQANCLYHEATFKNEDAQRATDTFHCTASQAATIAKLANVKKLLLGHFSAKYKTEQLDELLLQAKEIFDESYLSAEGLTFNIE